MARSRKKLSDLALGMDDDTRITRDNLVDVLTTIPRNDVKSRGTVSLDGASKALSSSNRRVNPPGENYIIPRSLRKNIKSINDLRNSSIGTFPLGSGGMLDPWDESRPNMMDTLGLEYTPTNNKKKK